MFAAINMNPPPPLRSASERAFYYTGVTAICGVLVVFGWPWAIMEAIHRIRKLRDIRA